MEEASTFCRLAIGTDSDGVAPICATTEGPTRFDGDLPFEVMEMSDSAWRRLAVWGNGGACCVEGANEEDAEGFES